MLSEIAKLIQHTSAEHVNNNQDIPNEQSEAVSALATQTVMNGLQGNIASGGLSSMLNMFAGKSASNQSNPMVSNMMSQLAAGLGTKMGLSESASKSLASTLIPAILNQVVSKTANPEDKSMDMNSLIGGLLGQKTEVGQPVQTPGQGNIDFMSIIGGLASTVGQQQASGEQATAPAGGFDIAQLAGLLGGQAQQQQSQQGGESGGMMDLLGGLLGGK